MQITILGYVLIPLALILFILKPDALFYFMIFFSNFLAAAVVNIEVITFGLQPSYMFGMFWIIHLIFKYIRKPPVVDRTAGRFLTALVLFWIVALFSLNMPLIYRHQILVHGPSDVWGFKPLNLSLTNFTQFLYLTFVLMIAAFTTLEARGPGKLANALKTILLSASFAVIWGFLQMFCFYTGRDYPYFLFNNNIGYAQLWNQIAGGIPRVSSIFTEPAAYSSMLLMVLPIVVVLWKNRVYLIGKNYLNLLLGCFFATILLTTSTTAYIGFVFSVAFMAAFTFFIRRNLPERFNNGINKKETILEFFRVSAIVVMFVAAILIVFIGAFGMDMERFLALLRSMTIDKASSSSGRERGEGFVNGIRILLESRFLGVGWGSNRTFDLGTTLLSNTGVIGFFMFILIFCKVLANCSRIFRTAEHYFLSSAGLAILISIATVLFIMFISGPDIVLLSLWIMTGLAMSLREKDPSIGVCSEKPDTFVSERAP